MWTITNKVLGALAAVFLLVSLGLILALRHANAEKVKAAFRADSTAAVASVTERVTNEKITKALAESTTLITRRIVQTETVRNRDEVARQIEKVLGQVQVLQASLTAQIRTVQGTVAGLGVTDSLGYRLAVFHRYSAPFTLDANVRLGPPPDSGRLIYEIRADRARLKGRLTCGASQQGVRRADLYLEPPEWLTVNVDSVFQDPSVCNSGKVGTPGKPWWRPEVHYLQITAGYDPLNRQGTVVIGPGLTW